MTLHRTFATTLISGCNKGRKSKWEKLWGCAHFLQVRYHHVLIPFWSGRPDVARRWKTFHFLRFFRKNDALRENSQNSVPKGFIATPIDVLCSNFVKFRRREIGKVVGCLPDKKNKISPGSPALATSRIAPKICQGQPQTMYPECFRFHSNRFTFGGVICKRVNTVRSRSKVNPIFGWSLASSRIKIEQLLVSQCYTDVFFAVFRCAFLIVPFYSCNALIQFLCTLGFTCIICWHLWLEHMNVLCISQTIYNKQTSFPTWSSYITLLSAYIASRLAIKWRNCRRNCMYTPTSKS